MRFVSKLPLPKQFEIVLSLTCRRAAHILVLVLHVCGVCRLTEVVSAHVHATRHQALDNPGTLRSLVVEPVVFTVVFPVIEVHGHRKMLPNSKTLVLYSNAPFLRASLTSMPTEGEGGADLHYRPAPNQMRHRLSIPTIIHSSPSLITIHPFSNLWG